LNCSRPTCLPDEGKRSGAFPLPQEEFEVENGRHPLLDPKSVVPVSFGSTGA
jgi:hypothetical protein